MTDEPPKRPEAEQLLHDMANYLLDMAALIQSLKRRIKELEDDAR